MRCVFKMAMSLGVALVFATAIVLAKPLSVLGVRQEALYWFVFLPAAIDWVVTLFWLYFDAKKIQPERYDGLVCGTPIAIVMAYLLLPGAVYFCYLYERSIILRGHARLKLKLATVG